MQKNYAELDFKHFLADSYMSSMGANSSIAAVRIQDAFEIWYHLCFATSIVYDKHVIKKKNDINRKSVAEALKKLGGVAVSRYWDQDHENYFVFGERHQPQAFNGVVSVMETNEIVTLALSGSPELHKTIYDLYANQICTNIESVKSIVNIDLQGSIAAVTSTLGLDTQAPILASSYPYFDRSIEETAQAYMASTARGLLLIGPPGTGKTSYLRRFIKLTGCKTSVCSDPTLVVKRELFTNFLSNDSKMLVLEDADMLVRSREDGNETMSVLLNILDGLLTTDKRIAISTNLPNLNSVDEALFRPGRCFDVLTFRALTKAEALDARTGLGLPFVAFDNHEKLTLSEAINFEQVRSIERHKKTSIGF